MPSAKKSSFADKAQRLLSSTLERIRQFALNSSIKDFILLALPYQVSAVLTALVAVGYAKLFHYMEQWNGRLLSIDPRLILVAGVPLCATGRW
jgi:hypothetical protein